MMTKEYYTRAFLAGRLRVEGRPNLGFDEPLKTCMCIRHLVHRHEPPVLAGSVQVWTFPPHTTCSSHKTWSLGFMKVPGPPTSQLHLRSPTSLPR